MPKITQLINGGVELNESSLFYYLNTKKLDHTFFVFCFICSKIYLEDLST